MSRNLLNKYVWLVETIYKARVIDCERKGGYRYCLN